MGSLGGFKMKLRRFYQLKGIEVKITEDELESMRNFERTFKEFCKKWKLEFNQKTLIWYLNNAYYFVKENLE